MNARFANKGLLKSDLATLNALMNYFEKGGAITVCKPGKRNLSRSPVSVRTIDKKVNSKKGA